MSHFFLLSQWIRSKKLSLSVCAGVLMFMAGVHMAQAEIFYWQEPESHVSLSFPDRWTRVNNQNPGDVMTIRAPGAYDFAQCQLNVQDDGRFKIYHSGYDAHIQRMNFSVPYWEAYYGRYNDVVFQNISDNAGLGRGFASMASAVYKTASGAKMDKTSVAFVSYYKNRVYTVECSAESGAYPKWHDVFLSVVKSIDFNDYTNNRAVTGYYRDFLRDKTLKISGQTVFEDSYH